MKYLIHSCRQRYWYVRHFLIPSMTSQGINRDDIELYLDDHGDGCLESCMKSFSQLPIDGDTWHFQDDVIICSDFAEKTQKQEVADIICGYCYRFDDNRNKTGYVKAKHMWYSFPCIKIPNKIARDCANWFYTKVLNDGVYALYVRSKKHDDTLFHMFVEDYHNNAIILNAVPNLVDHIDYLIGGSVINDGRSEKETHAIYFEETELVRNLEKKFNYNKNNS